MHHTESETRVRSLSKQLVVPASTAFAVAVLLPFVDSQINTSGVFANAFDMTMTVLSFVSLAWVFWVVSRLFFEWIILSPNIS